MEMVPGSFPRAGGIEDQVYSELQAIFEYRAAMNFKRLAGGSDADKEYLAKHPELGWIHKTLMDTQREIYLKPDLAAAIAVFRQAMKEQD